VFQILQIVAIVLVAGAMTPALAHALEYPGKLRLEKQAYIATQQIYYPGFTVGGGAAEVLAILATLLLVIHSFWVEGVANNRAGQGFFAFDPLGRAHDRAAPDWTELRDSWEISHMVRAGLSLLGLVLLAIAVVLEN
jgi:hypothetical protein